MLFDTNIEARTEALSSGPGKGVSRQRWDSMIDLSLLLTVRFWFSLHQLRFVIFFLMFSFSSPFADYESNRGHRCPSPPMALISFCYVCFVAVPLLHLDATPSLPFVATTFVPISVAAASTSSILVAAPPFRMSRGSRSAKTECPFIGSTWPSFAVIRSLPPPCLSPLPVRVTPGKGGVPPLYCSVITTN